MILFLSANDSLHLPRNNQLNSGIDPQPLLSLLPGALPAIGTTGGS